MGWDGCEISTYFTSGLAWVFDPGGGPVYIDSAMWTGLHQIADQSSSSSSWRFFEGGEGEKSNKYTDCVSGCW